MTQEDKASTAERLNLCNIVSGRVSLSGRVGSVGASQALLGRQLALRATRLFFVFLNYIPGDNKSHTLPISSVLS